MRYSPIVVFAYNRKKLLADCIESLKANEESKDSDLIIFVDGAKLKRDIRVEDVKAYVKSIRGFRTITYHFSSTNKGLARSVIEGVSSVLKEYGAAIVVEDDLIVGRNFLSFMNQGLNKYIDDRKVFSICGYTNKIKMPAGYHYDGYFCTRSSSWGWATWKDRWESCDWELKDWHTIKQKAKAFNKWGGSDCFSMLRGWKDGRINSWAIRFCYNQFVQNKLSLFPTISHVRNEGFDGEGTNCPRWNRFKCDFDDTDNKIFSLPTDTKVDKSLFKSAMSYNSLWARVYSKILNFFIDGKRI